MDTAIAVRKYRFESVEGDKDTDRFWKLFSAVKNEAFIAFLHLMEVKQRR